MDKPLPDHGSVGDVALPKNSAPTGRANSPSEPLNRNGGSVGDVALPKNSAPTGRANSPSEPPPQRKKLPHEIPSWVEQGTRHFITINCKHHGSDQLLKYAPKLLESAQHYEKIGYWFMWLMLVMPDHIHLIATFDLSRGIKQTIRAWKGYLARTLGIEWQSDFFEHRLRNQSEFDEKAHYIRTNPVRAKLVIQPKEWPHILDRDSIDSGSPRRFALPETSEKKWWGEASR